MGHFKKKLIKVLCDYSYNFACKDFIKKKLNSKKKRKKITNMLPTIVSYTNEYNLYWIDTVSYFKEEKHFLDKLFESLSFLNLHDTDVFFERLISRIREFEITEKQIILLIKIITESRFEISSDTLINIYHFICEKKPSMIPMILTMVIENEKICASCVCLFSLKNFPYMNIMYEHIDFVLRHIYSADLFYLLDIVKNDEKSSNKVKKAIKNNEEEAVSSLITDMYDDFINIQNLKQEERKKLSLIIEIVYLILKDICKNEHTEIFEMKQIGGGAFSKVISLGNKIIKIGCQRGTNRFPNNPYINAILLRKEFFINDSVSFFIEVNEKVDTNSMITIEELYQLYKKFREIHLIWVDVSQQNVGRLYGDNKVKWRQDLPITDKVLGLDSYRGNTFLKKGELVVLDNDLIYDENTENWILMQYQSALQEEFERRYQSEKRKNLRIRRFKYRMGG